METDYNNSNLKKLTTMDLDELIFITESERDFEEKERRSNDSDNGDIDEDDE